MGEQSLTSDIMFPIMLRNAKGWDQEAVFVTLTMRHKMELAWERQRRPTAAATKHLTPDLAIPFGCH